MAPTVVTQNITVQLDGSGAASIVPGDIDDDSSDACGIQSMTLDVEDFDCSDVGPNTVTLTVTDVNGNSESATATVTVEDNIDPTWLNSAGSLDVTFYCGQVNDLEDAQALEPEATDNCSGTTIAKTSGAFVPSGDYGAGTYTNTWIATDASGNTSTVFTQTITVLGITIDASASSNPVNKNEASVTLSATVSPAVSGVLVNFYLDDEYEDSAETDGTGTATIQVAVSGNLDVNVYKITAEAGNGCHEDVAYMPVYDPDGGFVTGGGWINSPAGALVADPTVVGKANFGFNAKYKKGRSDVDGNTEFQFKAGNLNFKSNLHESGSLVIAGNKAMYRGEGTINGTGDYKFSLVAFDGDMQGGDGYDRFRIKIWGDNGIVYDNAVNDPDDNSNDATILGDNGRGGGSIVIHQVNTPPGKNKSAEIEISLEPEVHLPMFNVYPNPFSDRLRMEFVSEETTHGRIDLFDMTGRLVKTVFDQPVNAGELYQAEFVPGSEVSSFYIYRVTLGESVRNGRVIYRK